VEIVRILPERKGLLYQRMAPLDWKKEHDFHNGEKGREKKKKEMNSLSVFPSGKLILGDQ